MSEARSFKEYISKLPSLHRKLNDSSPMSISPAKQFPNSPGIYVLMENEQPIYVGRSKKIRQRIQNHIGGRPEQSSFAFKLAREITGKKASYKPEGSRQDLMNDPDFKNAFQITVDRIRNLKVKFVIIEDDVLQHLFEVYASLELKTPHNQFGTS